MKTALIAILMTVTPAAGDPAEDFLACVIGRAAVALISGEIKEEALEAGYDLCPLPADPKDEIDIDTLGNTINLMVERMAGD